MTLKLHVAINVVADRSHGVRKGRAAEAGSDLFGSGATADDAATLQYQRLEPRLSEIKSGDQTVVPTTDNNDFLLFAHGLDGAALPVVQDLHRRQPTGSAHDAAAGVRGRAAHIKVLHRRAVLRPSRDRTQEEQLLERELALEDVSFGQSELAFQVERRDHLASTDDALDVGRVFGDGVDDGVAEGFFLFVPGAFFQFVRRVLHKAGHDVLAGGRDGRIGQAGYDHVNVRTA